MEELELKINVIKEDIKEIEQIYLPDAEKIYFEAEDAKLKLDALNAIIGLKNQFRSDEYRLEQMEAVLDRMAKEKEME
jgi:hypothetical protein